MSRLLIFLAVICLICGCEHETPKPLFEGKVEFQKANGNVISVTVTFPRTGTTGLNADNQNYVKLTNRQEVEDLELQMQSMLKDIQYAMEQMPVSESVVKDEIKQIDRDAPL